MPTAPLVVRHPVLIMRHGQTDWNVEGRFQGQTDIPVNDVGRSQATENGHRLKATFGDALASWAYLASPMSRTCESMERARAALGLEPKTYATDARLIEVSFGDWERRTLEEIGVQDPELIATRTTDKWRFVPPRGESYAQYAERIRPVFEALAGPSFVVAHGGTMRALYAMTGIMAESDAANAEIPQDQVLMLRPDGHAWI